MPGNPEAAFSPDGNYFAVWQNERGLELWDLHTGQSIAVLDGRTEVHYPAGPASASTATNPAPYIKWINGQATRDVVVSFGAHDDSVTVTETPPVDLAHATRTVHTANLVAPTGRLGGRGLHARRPRPHARRMEHVHRCGRPVPPHLHVGGSKPAPVAPVVSRTMAMDPEELENVPPQGHVRVVYLGPVAPHWEIHRVFGDPKAIDEFAERAQARLQLLPPHDPQFRRNRERVARDAEREHLILDWDLGYDEGA